jgi:uncharacterized protein
MHIPLTQGLTITMTISDNRLSEETSPYLLQHRENPVHWQPWSDATLAQARQTGKPILLSVGYAACHWCHVMAHESFEDPAIASVMNELFINIKVDREERPDIDSIYQSALQMMGEQGGWPLTMFLTPEGEPFWGGTYFPPTARYGRPGFPEVLKSVHHAFHQQKDQIATNIAALRDGLEKMSNPQGGGSLTISSLDSIATALLRTIDPITGGTMGAPKFPQPTIFQYLWRAYRRSKSPLFRDAVTLTLNHICQGGIYDHLGGGFARYSTDEVWLAPHFEKMLYDNALLIELLCDVWLETSSSLYEARIRETIAWALRELRVEADGQNAFVSAYDADSEGEEGKFYVWSESEIDTLLEGAAEKFKAAYDVGPRGNWEGKVILNRSHQLSLGDDADEAELAKAREKLLAVRAERIWPSRDDKVLADWNGLMIAALVRASVVFGEPAWMAAAKSAYAFVSNQMADGHRLHHSWCAGHAAHPGVLEDYTNMARAALALHEASGEEGFLTQAQNWIQVADDHYWDADNGGYFMSADDTADILVRPKPIHDNATPPGNGVITEVLARLHHLTGDTAYRDRLDALISALVPPETDKAIYQLSLLMGFETMERAVQIVIVGAPDSADGLPTGLVRDALVSAPSTRHLIYLKDGAELPDTHPAHGKARVDGKPTAYVCVGTTCTLPLTSAEELRDHLRSV